MKRFPMALLIGLLVSQAVSVDEPRWRGFCAGMTAYFTILTFTKDGEK